MINRSEALQGLQELASEDHTNDELDSAAMESEGEPPVMMHSNGGPLLEDDNERRPFGTWTFETMQLVHFYCDSVHRHPL